MLNDAKVSHNEVRVLEVSPARCFSEDFFFNSVASLRLMRAGLP